MRIDSKPTEYLNIRFKSRLEARWAVFLNEHFVVTEFRYEPFTVNNKYTPDFLVTTNIPQSFVLEVKPQLPNEQTINELKEIADTLKHDLYLAFGSFYKDERPKLQKINPKRMGPVLELSDIFVVSESAINAAKSHRFDL